MNTSKRAKPANSQARHPLSPAERTAKLLAFRANYSHNFTTTKVEQVPVPYARGAMRTS